MLIDPTIIATRLRVTLEHLFQVNNHAIYLGLIHPHVAPLTLQMNNRVSFCIDEVARIIKELEPKKIDTGCLTLEEALILEGYQEIKQGLMKSWQFIENRTQVIIQQAANRIPNSDGASPSAAQ